MRSRPLALSALAVAAFLFGSTFVVIKEAVELLPPMAFVGWRFLLGAVALFAMGIPRDRTLWRHGLVAGALLFIGYASQTQGLSLTSASNSGLITGLYIVFTPLLAAAVAHRRPAAGAVVGAALAFVGLALLTLGPDGRLAVAPGDLLTVVCAIAFAGHIVYLSRVAFRFPVVPFTAVQLLTTSVLALLASAAWEGLPVPGIDVPLADIAPALLLTGLAVSAGAFLLQVWAQTVVGPSTTAIVLSLEPAFAAWFAALVLDERLGLRGWVGAGFILVGIWVVLASVRDETVPAAEAISPAH